MPSIGPIRRFIHSELSWSPNKKERNNGMLNFRVNGHELRKCLKSRGLAKSRWQLDGGTPGGGGMRKGDANCYCWFNLRRRWMDSNDHCDSNSICDFHLFLFSNEGGGGHWTNWAILGVKWGGEVGRWSEGIRRKDQGGLDVVTTFPIFHSFRAKFLLIYDHYLAWSSPRPLLCHRGGRKKGEEKRIPCYLYLWKEKEKLWNLKCFVCESSSTFFFFFFFLSSFVSFSPGNSLVAPQT